MAVRRAVEHLVERVRGVRQGLELVVGDADVEFLGVFRLELQRRDDRDEIGVAAALAQPVQRALNLARAGAHGRERIRHRLLGVVVGVNADVIAGDMLDHLADDRLDLVRQRAAVGVAQHHPARAFLVGGLGAGEREFRIGLVAVEEMLAVEQHLAALLPWRRGRCRGSRRGSPRAWSRARPARDSPRTWRRSRWRRPWPRAARRAPDRSRPSGPGRRVMPNAVKVASSARGSANSCVSVGLAPG